MLEKNKSKKQVIQNMYYNGEDKEILEKAITLDYPVLMVGDTGVGKCLGKGTPILMFDGAIKKVEDVKRGDLIMGDNSTPRKVLSLAGGKEMMYKVIPNKGDSYIVNESHILSLKKTRKEKGMSKGEILDIEVKDYLKKSDRFKHLHKGYRTGVVFKKEKLEIEPYFLGVWLGDGDKSSVKVTTKDKEIVNYLKKYADRLKLQLTKNRTLNRCSVYSIANKGKGNYKNSLQLILRNVMLINNKHIPFKYKTSDRLDRLNLLAGLIDSDGYVANTNYVFCNTNEVLINDVVYLCRSLGFAAYKKKYIAKMLKENGEFYECEAFKISISGECSEIPVKIKRKQVKCRKQKKDVLVTGIKLKKLKVDNYYGFEIDGNKRFLLGDFTVTHNTSFIRSIAQKRGKKLIRLNLTGQTGVDEVLGKWLVKGRDMYWADGLLIKAMKEGNFIVFDEINMALPEILSCLHSLLDDDRSIVLKEKNGETIFPHPGFRFFATMNPEEEYAGTKELNKAFISRFPIIMNIDYSEKETDILVERTSISDDDSERLVLAALEIRKQKAKETIDYVCSTRDLLSCGYLLNAGFKPQVALEISIFNKVNNNDRDKVRKVFELVTGKNISIETDEGSRSFNSLSDIRKFVKDSENKVAKALEEKNLIKKNLIKLETDIVNFKKKHKTDLVNEKAKNRVIKDKLNKLLKCRNILKQDIKKLINI